MTDKDEDDKDIDDDEEKDSGDSFDFSDLFSDPNKLFKSKNFKRVFKEIFENVIKNLPTDLKNLSPEDLQKEIMKNKAKFGFKGPFMYGFNVSLGPDGPKIESFGNIKQKPYSTKPEVNENREPLVDINEEEDQIVVVAEMPGVEKEDITSKAMPHSLIISAQSKGGERKYYKEVALPKEVDPNNSKARYKNGILEVKLKKAEATPKDVDIE